MPLPADSLPDSFLSELDGLTPEHLIALRDLLAESIETVTGQIIDMADYNELADFRGWLANAVPNLRSGTFRLQFDTEGTNPVPHADLINAYGEMLVVRVYRMKPSAMLAKTQASPQPETQLDPQLVEELVEMGVAGNGLEPAD